MLRGGFLHILYLLSVFSLVIGIFVIYRLYQSKVDYKDSGTNTQREFGESVKTTLDNSYGDESEYSGYLRYEGESTDNPSLPVVGGNTSSPGSNGLDDSNSNDKDDDGSSDSNDNQLASPEPSPAVGTSGGSYTTTSGCLVPNTKPSFTVKPYLVYPADKAPYVEYEPAVKNYMTELQDWYCQKAGVTFGMEALSVKFSSFDYLTIRCGSNPSDNCKDNLDVLEGNWGYYMNRAIHNGIEKWEEQTVALLFTVGGGGYAGANVYTNHAGFAIVGDWALEGITGKRNDWGINCSYASWQCDGGTPKGTPAHELGHAFGLSHPDPNLYPDKSIMKWHGDYPDTEFLPHEIDHLKNSPFFTHDVLGITNKPKLNKKNSFIEIITNYLSNII